MGLLGAIMYENATAGETCKIDLYKENRPEDQRAYWPAREALPSTEGLGVLGGIIDGCWRGGFASADELVAALEALAHEDDDEKGDKDESTGTGGVLGRLCESLVQRPSMAAMTVGVGVCIFMAWRRRP